MSGIANSDGKRQACIDCGKVYPATNDYFHKSKDGLHPRCKQCRNKKIRKARKSRTTKRLDEIERGALDVFVGAARIGGANIPHSSELLEVLMEYFGGVRGFANCYMKQFYDSTPGGAFRTKMLEGVMRLVTTNTAMGGAKKPLELMTEEELEAELRRQVLEAATAVQAVTVVDSPRIEHAAPPPQDTPSASS
jgi:DNA-directed RNA polymerase subunit RPC12/RpoP